MMCCGSGPSTRGYEMATQKKLNCIPMIRTFVLASERPRWPNHRLNHGGDQNPSWTRERSWLGQTLFCNMLNAPKQCELDDTVGRPL